MRRPHHNPAEIARSALAELPRNERDNLLIELLSRSDDLVALTYARNAVTERAADIIADRYADQLIEENHRERVL